MIWSEPQIPKLYCFSLGDFHDFDFCPFRFFVNHHLEKKYELAEGSENLALGSLLDLAVKRLHHSKAYGVDVNYLPNLVKAAENHIRWQAQKEGPKSFYGPILPFLSEGVINKAQQIFKSYLLLGGKFNRAIHKNKLKPFWKYPIQADQPLLLWGGADGIELGDDGVPEVVDYKYMEDNGRVTDKLDMDLMPKIYTLLCSKELLQSGYQKARFKVRLFNDPLNGSFYEEFDLASIDQLASFFKDKIDKILATSQINFCEKDFCKACKSAKRKEWVQQLSTQFNLS